HRRDVPKELLGHLGAEGVPLHRPRLDAPASRPGTAPEPLTAGEVAEETRPEHRDDPVEGPAEAELDEAVPAGARGDEGRPRHPLAGELPVATSEADDRHATHRVADEDDLALRCRRVDDRPQVAPELVDGAVLEVADLGQAVVALVVADDAVPLLDELPPLVDPRAEVEHEAVDEHDGRAVALGPALRLVDLDVEDEAVTRGHGEDLVGLEGEDVHLVRGGHRVRAGAGDGAATGEPRTGDDGTADDGGRKTDAGPGGPAGALRRGFLLRGLHQGAPR